MYLFISYHDIGRSITFNSILNIACKQEMDSQNSFFFFLYFDGASVPQWVKRWSMM